MGTLDDALKTMKALKPGRIAAGLEIDAIVGPVTALDVWGLLEAARMFVDLTPDRKAAVERLKEFVSRPGPMKFTKLDRATVAMQALARVCNHGLIDQNAFGICGPAAIASETAATRPVEYAKLVSGLCDDGECQFRHLNLKPAASILGHDPGADMPQADWVVCASLRNDGKGLQGEFSKETYGGSTVEEVYKWMVKAGYRKVIGVSTRPWSQFCKMHPPEMKPPVLDPSDNAKAIEVAVGLSQAGWQVFLGGYMSLTKAVESLHRAQEDADEVEEPKILDNARDAESKKLLSKTPGRFKTLAVAAKTVLLKKAPEDGAHWMYVESMKPSSLDGHYLTVTCCSHGVQYRSVNVPLAGFVNKSFGYVAVTDLD